MKAITEEIKTFTDEELIQLHAETLGLKIITLRFKDQPILEAIKEEMKSLLSMTRRNDNIKNKISRVEELKEQVLIRDSVKENDFFIMSEKKGYAPSQRKDAMQVMECNPSEMTVRCKGGCITKPYDHFELVTDLSPFKDVYTFDSFEDNRNK